MESGRNSYADIAKMYAERVVAGEILACKWVKAACKRQLNDLKKFKGKSSPYQFNPKLTSKSGKSYYPADNLCAFIERLPHVKGPLAGEPITLEPWQVFILATVFGWVKADGTRRFRRSYIEVPESPRVLRRLQPLRRWSYEQIKSFFPRSTRTRCSHVARPPWRISVHMGGH